MKSSPRPPISALQLDPHSSMSSGVVVPPLSPWFGAPKLDSAPHVTGIHIYSCLGSQHTRFAQRVPETQVIVSWRKRVVDRVRGIPCIIPHQ